jgi:RimJ/RimL family protein N-acetyltransferase
VAERGEDVRLRDGSLLRLRPIEPTDADGILQLHARLSDRSRYFRFFGAYPRMPVGDLRHFVNVDHRDREAFVAVLDNDLVGVGRYERLPQRPDSAEVAFVIVDEFQRRGIGPILLARLVTAAREVGIAQFIAEVLPANTPMMRVFARAGFSIDHEYSDGVIHVSFPIDDDDEG